MLVHQSINAVTVAQLTSCIFVCCFATSITLWRLQQDGPSNQLPTISFTFAVLPANFISRIAFNCGCVGLMIIMCLVYLSNKSNRHIDHRANSILYAMGIVGTILLNVVAAVCDDPNHKECAGNFSIHIVSAIVFFILYDLYLFFSIELNVEKNRLHRFVLFLKLVSKVRFIIPFINSSGTFNLVSYIALFEWTDVMCIIVLIYSLVYTYCRDIHIQLVSDVSEKEPILKRVKSIHLLYFTVCFCVSAMLLELFFYRQFERDFPKLEELDDERPNNWISRFSGVKGLLLLFSHVGMYDAYQSMISSSKLRIVVLVASIISCVGVLICSDVNELEYLPLRVFGAGLLYGSYDVFMLIIGFSMLSYYKKLHTEESIVSLGSAVLSVIAVASLLTKVRYFYDVVVFDIQVNGLLEWLNLAYIFLFLVLLAIVHYEKLSQLEYVFVQSHSKVLPNKYSLLQ